MPLIAIKLYEVSAVLSQNGNVFYFKGKVDKHGKDPKHVWVSFSRSRCPKALPVTGCSTKRRFRRVVLLGREIQEIIEAFKGHSQGGYLRLPEGLSNPRGALTKKT